MECAPREDSDWSESSLSAWINIGSSNTHLAHCEDSDQTGRMPNLIWVFTGRTVILLVLSWGGSSTFVVVLRPFYNMELSFYLTPFYNNVRYIIWTCLYSLKVGNWGYLRFSNSPFNTSFKLYFCKIIKMAWMPKPVLLQAMTTERFWFYKNACKIKQYVWCFQMCSIINYKLCHCWVTSLVTRGAKPRQF